MITGFTLSTALNDTAGINALALTSPLFGRAAALPARQIQLSAGFSF